MTKREPIRLTLKPSYKSIQIGMAEARARQQGPYKPTKVAWWKRLLRKVWLS